MCALDLALLAHDRASLLGPLVCVPQRRHLGAERIDLALLAHDRARLLGPLVCVPQRRHLGAERIDLALQLRQQALRRVAFHCESIGTVAQGLDLSRFGGGALRRALCTELLLTRTKQARLDEDGSGKRLDGLIRRYPDSVLRPAEPIRELNMVAALLEAERLQRSADLRRQHHRSDHWSLQRKNYVGEVSAKEGREFAPGHLQNVERVRGCSSRRVVIAVGRADHKAAAWAEDATYL
jgi:hypothetical protein